MAMDTHSINLAFRFLLEMAGLTAIGYWGWALGDGVVKVVLAFALPMIAAIIWGTFAVPGDPSRSGEAPVPIGGRTRLLLELVFFAVAVAALIAVNQPTLAWVFAGFIAVHYAFSHQRLSWLFQQ